MASWYICALCLAGRYILGRLGFFFGGGRIQFVEKCHLKSSNKKIAYLRRLKWILFCIETKPSHCGCSTVKCDLLLFRLFLSDKDIPSALKASSVQTHVNPLCPTQPCRLDQCKLVMIWAASWVYHEHVNASYR